MTFELSPEDLKVFLEEADEQLQVLEEGIMELERSGSDEALLQGIFRAAHTLKGSSATLGHHRMAEFTHHVENVLDKLRKGTLGVSGALADLLLECLDALRLFKDEIATGNPAEVDTTGLIARLDAIATGREAPPGATRAGDGVIHGSSLVAGDAARQGGKWVGGGAIGPAGGPFGALDEEAALRCREAMRAGQSVLALRLRIDPKNAMPSVRAFQALHALSEQGELIWSRPSQAEVEDEQVGEELLAICAGAAPEGLRAALGEIAEIEVVSLEPYQPDAEPGPAGGGYAAQAAAEAAAALAPVAERPVSGAVGGLSGRVGPSAATRAGGGLRGGRTVRVDVEVLDNLMNLVGELVIDRGRLTQLVGELDDKMTGDLAENLAQTSSHIGRVAADLQDEIMRARMVPVDSLFKKFPRMVRDLAASFGKEIEFVVRGEETELDRSVIEEIGDPLMHLIRNAVDHGIEPPAVRRAAGKPERGTLLLEASHEENAIIITVKDDGKGIDPAFIRQKAIERGLLGEEAARRLDERQVVDLIFQPGFSTQDQISEISGRGVGMDVVRSNIDRLKGTIEIQTAVGKGTTFRIKLPLTLAIIRALLVEVGGQVFAIPLTSVTETLHVRDTEVRSAHGEAMILVRGRAVPLLRLAEHFEIPAERAEGSFPVVVAAAGSQRFALAVGRLIGEQEIVVKSLGRFIGDIPGISGATIIGDGSVALIIEVPALMESAGMHVTRA